MGLYDAEYPYQIDIINSEGKIVETADTNGWTREDFNKFKKRYISSINYKFVGKYKSFSTLCMTSYITSNT